MDSPSRSERTIFPFLDLPFEVREISYYQHVRPWNSTYYSGGRFIKGGGNALGCTNILLVNNTIHREAIQVFHELPATLASQRRRRQIFRHPLNQGKPGLFHSYTETSAKDIDSSLTQLEFIKLRYANMWIRYGIDAFNDAVEDLHAVIRVQHKSHNLKEIHLVLGPATGNEN